MMNRKVAVIGGSGFIGSRLAKRFRASEIRFNLCDIKGFKEATSFIELDIEDPESLRKLEGFSEIINLAAIHRDDVKPISRYDEVNVEGSKSLCLMATKLGINKIIFTSSVAIYGFANNEISEDGEPNYFNDYGRTKYLAEGVYKKWQSEDPRNRTLVIIRPTVVFGEGNRGNVFNLMKQIASKRFVMFGSGKNIKSMAYVENLTAFLEHSLGFNPGVHIYNYVDKPDLDMNTLVSLIRKVLFNKESIGFRLPAFLGIGVGYLADLISFISRKPLSVSSLRVKKFMGTTQFSSAVNDTDFIAPVSLEDGLIKTLKYEFLEDNSDEPTFDTE